MSTEVVKEAKLEEEPRQCTKKEKLGHAIGVLGHDSMYTLWSTWTTPFLTDILKLPAGFLAFLFGGARFFDAFTDISMGIIADRTRSKWGRFRPWLLRSGPLMGICLALSFFKPDIGTIGLCIFAGIMYIITGSIVFTILELACGNDQQYERALGNCWLHYHRVQYHYWNYWISDANGTGLLWRI